jgi:hypothetical protein
MEEKFYLIGVNGKEKPFSFILKEPDPRYGERKWFFFENKETKITMKRPTLITILPLNKKEAKKKEKELSKIGFQRIWMLKEETMQKLLQPGHISIFHQFEFSNGELIYGIENLETKAKDIIEKTPNFCNFHIW